MKNTGTLRIQTFAARQSAPMEGVTVAVQGDGFTLHCITDATGKGASAAPPSRRAPPPISPLKPPPAPSRWTRTTPSALTPLSA